MVDAEIPPQSHDNTRRGLLASFSLEEVELLRVIVDTVIPEDAYPGGWSGRCRSAPSESSRGDGRACRTAPGRDASH